MLYPCICNVVISCWKSGAYGYVICRGGTDMCFVSGSGWKHLDLEQYRISVLTIVLIHNDKHIVDLPQRFLYGRINEMNTKRTRIKGSQFKHIIHSFGHAGATRSNVT